MLCVLRGETRLRVLGRTQVSDRTHSLCPRMPGDGLFAVYKPLLFLLSPSALLFSSSSSKVWALVGEQTASLPEAFA